MELINKVNAILRRETEIAKEVQVLFGWDKPITPNLPKFERLQMIKKGKRVSPDTALEIMHIARYQKILEEGKARNTTHNPCYNKELTEDAGGVIHGIVSSFEVASTHNGSKLLRSVIRAALYDLSILSTKGLELAYRLSPAQARRYMQAIKIILPIVSKPKNMKLNNDWNLGLGNLL